jgi:hypothetical protein
MSYYRDELAMVAENSDYPIPFEEAVTKDMVGKTFVFVSPTIQTSEMLFERYRAVLPPSLIRLNSSRRRIYLGDADHTRVLFLTEYDVEHNALRGLGKVVWVC